MNRLTDQQYEQIASCLARCEMLVAAYRFGSQCDPRRESPRDVDIALLRERKFTLDELLALRSDLCLLLGTDHIDLVDMRAAGPVLKRNVVAAGGRFFCRDEHEANEFELRALAEYQDSNYRRRVQLEILRESLQQR